MVKHQKTSTDDKTASDRNKAKVFERVENMENWQNAGFFSSPIP